MTVEKPFFIWLALAAIPVAILIDFRIKSPQKFASTKKIRICAALRVAAWFCLCVALARPCIGTKTVAQTKTGNFVAVVVDVSQSMNASDENLAGKNATRLDAAKAFACEFLEKAKISSASLVAAKGGAQVLIPLTRDFLALKTALSFLSSMSVAAAGTDLSCGIDEAAFTLARADKGACGILCLTDGEELSGDVRKAALRAAKSGIKVAFAGFGSEKGCEILAGDGKTRVFSAMQSKKLEKIASEIGGLFAKSSEKDCLDKVFGFLIENFDENSEKFTVFESKPAERWQIFAGFAFFFLLFSMIFADFDFQPLIFLSAVAVFSACSADFKAQTALARGVFRSSKGDYSDAAADFLQCLARSKDNETASYAKFGMAAAFLQAGEIEAAKSLFLELTGDVPQRVLFSANFNLGCISAQEGDFDSAARFFRSALAANSQSDDAKINLDLAQKKCEKKRKVNADIQKSEQKGEDEQASAIFEILQKEEENRWKSARKTCEESPLDY